MNILVIHGHKLTRKGFLNLSYQNALLKSVELIRNIQFDKIVITGGKTRKKIASEAEVGFNFLKEKIDDTSKIILEAQSHSTIQNILNTKNILGSIHILNIQIIVPEESVRRINYLYKRLWPETDGHKEVITVKGLNPALVWTYELLSFIWARLFISEDFLLTKFAQKTMRNR